MNKIQLRSDLLNDPRIQTYKSLYEANKIPFESQIDDIIRNNGWQEYSQIIKVAIEVLEKELGKCLVRPPKTTAGKVLRWAFGWLYKIG